MRLDVNTIISKKSETELTASILKKDPKHKRGFKPASLQIILAAFEQTMSGKISRNLPDQI